MVMNDYALYPNHYYHRHHHHRHHQTYGAIAI